MVFVLYQVESVNLTSTRSETLTGLSTTGLPLAHADAVCVCVCVCVCLVLCMRACKACVCLFIFIACQDKCCATRINRGNITLQKQCRLCLYPPDRRCKRRFLGHLYRSPERTECKVRYHRVPCIPGPSACGSARRNPFLCFHKLFLVQIPFSRTPARSVALRLSTCTRMNTVINRQGNLRALSVQLTYRAQRRDHVVGQLNARIKIQVCVGRTDAARGYIRAQTPTAAAGSVDKRARAGGRETGRTTAWVYFTVVCFSVMNQSTTAIRKYALHKSIDVCSPGAVSICQGAQYTSFRRHTRLLGTGVGQRSQRTPSRSCPQARCNPCWKPDHSIVARVQCVQHARTRACQRVGLHACLRVQRVGAAGDQRGNTPGTWNAQRSTTEITGIGKACISPAIGRWRRPAIQMRKSLSLSLSLSRGERPLLGPPHGSWARNFVTAVRCCPTGAYKIYYTRKCVGSWPVHDCP